MVKDLPAIVGNTGKVSHAREQLSPCATTVEPRKATTMRSSCTTMKSSSQLAATREDPVQPKIDKIVIHTYIQAIIS